MSFQPFTTPTGLSLEIRAERQPDETVQGMWTVRVEGGYLCNAVLAPRELVRAPGGTQPHDQPWTADQILAAVAYAVQTALVSPPEKTPGKPFRVPVTHYDLYAANGKLRETGRP